MQKDLGQYSRLHAPTCFEPCAAGAVTQGLVRDALRSALGCFLSVIDESWRKDGMPYRWQMRCLASAFHMHVEWNGLVLFTWG